MQKNRRTATSIITRRTLSLTAVLTGIMLLLASLVSLPSIILISADASAGTARYLLRTGSSETTTTIEKIYPEVSNTIGSLENNEISSGEIIFVAHVEAAKAAEDAAFKKYLKCLEIAAADPSACENEESEFYKAAEEFLKALALPHPMEEGTQGADGALGQQLQQIQQQLQQMQQEQQLQRQQDQQQAALNWGWESGAAAGGIAGGALAGVVGGVLLAQGGQTALSVLLIAGGIGIGGAIVVGVVAFGVGYGLYHILN